jgi:peptide deformylase
MSGKLVAMPTKLEVIPKKLGVMPMKNGPIRPAERPSRLEDLAEKYEGIPFDDSRVVKYGETPGWEMLRQKAAPIEAVTPDILALIDTMGDIMYTAHGVGLAAPQVGQSIRLFVYDVGDGLTALINPEILHKKGEQYEPEEGCLSIPGLRGVVPRAKEIKVKALDITGNAIYFKAKEFEARVIQHEFDHLEGVLFTDLAKKGSLHMLTPEEIARENSGDSGDSDDDE